MQLTLCDGKLYRLSFRHDYSYDYRLVDHEFDFDEDTKEITEHNTWAIVTKTPEVTCAFLNEIDPVTGKRVHEYVDYYGYTERNPIDNPNKESARRIALTRLIKMIEDPNDRHLVDQCYTNRRSNQGVAKTKATV